MVKKSKQGGRKLHRSSGENSQTRARKKLTEKSEWFRKADKTDQSDPEDENDRSLDRWLKDGSSQKTGQDKNQEMDMETRSVLFVEQSKGGN